MRIPYNKVLVRPNPTDRIELSTGHTLFLDTSFEEFKNAPSSGTVVQVPDKLLFGDERGLDYDTDMDVRIGDTVIYTYLAESYCKSNGMVHEDCFFIDYDQLFVAIRGTEVICLNDYIIVEPVETHLDSSVVIPNFLKNQKSKKAGIVRYAGKGVRAYRMFPDAISAEVSVGDRILFHFADAVPLQQNMAIHGTISKSMLYKMQRKDVIAIDNEQQYIPEYVV